MTTEEKARAYDEALAWMRELYPGLHGATKEEAEHYFPELRESEDERIRKWILLKVQEYVSKAPVCSDEIKMGDKAIDWLEKQKESLHIQETCKESADSFTDSVIEVRSFQRGIEEGRRQEQEKHKEPHYTKRNALFDKCVENCDPAVMKEVSDEIDEMLKKEQKPTEKPSTLQILREHLANTPREQLDAEFEALKDLTIDKLDKYEEGDDVRVIILPKEDEK